MGIYDGLKDAAGILKEAGKIEQYQQILDAQQRMLEMQHKISELEGEKKILEEKLELKGKVSYHNNAYWMTNETGKEEGPFCTVCWDADRKLVRMHPDGNPAYYNCQKCKSDSVIIYPEKDIIRNQFQDNREPFDPFSTM